MAGPVKEFEVHPYVQFMMDRYSPYKNWIESEGVPIIGGAFVNDVRTAISEASRGRGWPPIPSATISSASNTGC